MTYLSNKSRVPGEESSFSDTLFFQEPLPFPNPLFRSSLHVWAFFISEIKHRVKFLRILWVKSKQRINKKRISLLKEQRESALNANQEEQEVLPYSCFEALKVRDLGSSRCPAITLSIIKLILFSLSDIKNYLEEIRKDFTQPTRSTTSISEHKKRARDQFSG